MISDITFVIFTFNEEARIEKVIKNFIGFGNVLLADDGSTDKTHEIAHANGASVIIRAGKYVFTENQEMLNQIYANITTNWIYWGYADEMLEKKALDKIQEIIASDIYDIINIDKKNYYYGKFCYNLFHARTDKIFKKGAVDYTENRIHGFGKPMVNKDRICILNDKYFVHHFINSNAKATVNMVNRYTDYEVPFKIKLPPSILFFYLMGRGFFAHYIKEKGYKAGFAGMAYFELLSFYFVVKSHKLYEKQMGLDIGTIEEKNNRIKDAFLQEFKR